MKKRLLFGAFLSLSLSLIILSLVGMPWLDEEDLVEVPPVPNPDLPPKEACYSLRNDLYDQCLAELKLRPELGRTMFDCKAVYRSQDIFCLCEGEVEQSLLNFCSDSCNVQNAQCVSDSEFAFNECLARGDKESQCEKEEDALNEICKNQLVACRAAKNPVPQIA